MTETMNIKHYLIHSRVRKKILASLGKIKVIFPRRIHLSGGIILLAGQNDCKNENFPVSYFIIGHFFIFISFGAKAPMEGGGGCWGV